MEKYINVKNGQIFTQIIGNGEKFLIVIHGGPDWDHSYLLSIADEIKKSHTIIFFDLRGCGKSSNFENIYEYSIEAVVEDMKSIIEFYKIKKVSVLGFSFGGQILINFINKYPEYTDKLIFASSTCFYDFQYELHQSEEFISRNTDEIKNLINQSFHESEIKGEEPARTMAIKTLNLDIYDLTKKEEIEKIIRKINFSGEWLKSFRTDKIKTKKIDGVSVFKKLNKPLLIIHGEKDMRFPVSTALRLHEKIESSELHILKNTGHLAHLEKKEEWNRILVNFLNK